MLVNLDDAQKISGILQRHLLVKGIELFGSVARTGTGNDLDLILLADDHNVADFITQTKMRIRAWVELTEIEAELFIPYDPDQLSPRELAAVDVFGKDFRILLEDARRLVPREPHKSTIDLFVLPLNWREMIDELEKIYPQGRRKFWMNVAREAIRLE